MSAKQPWVIDSVSSVQALNIACDIRLGKYVNMTAYHNEDGTHTGVLATTDRVATVCVIQAARLSTPNEALRWAVREYATRYEDMWAQPHMWYPGYSVN